MENKVSINNNSVEFSGITREYTEAIAELIWNAYDAGASRVDIVFDANEIDFIPSLEIIDNGSGIHFDQLSQTFGAFLDSLKRAKDQRSSYVRGKKGKGRFSFMAFAQSATWDTTYQDENSGQYLRYPITIHADNKDYYYDGEKSVATLQETGTRLQLQNLFGVTAYTFSSESFMHYLKHEFGWFLLLNSKRNYQLRINGEPIRYEDCLADHQVFQEELGDASTTRYAFTITFVRWKEKIGDKFYYYFLDSERKEVFKQLTSFNNNAIQFYHSVYVESDYFNHFHFNDEESTADLFGSNPQSPVFRQLIKILQGIVSRKEQAYIRDTAATAWVNRLELLNRLPAFGTDEEGLHKRRQLLDWIKELYAIQPRLFKGLNDVQEKMLLAMMASQLQDQAAFLSLIEQLMPLSEEERGQLKGLVGKRDRDN